MTSSKKREGRATPLDWKQIRNRLATTETNLKQAQQLSPERAQALLEERARAIARVPSEAPAAGALIEAVIFNLGNERYALETRYVREVLRFKDSTPLPGTPAFLVGITNLRGQILALFDLRAFFGIASEELSAQSRLIVLGEQRSEFGMVADTVHEVALLRLAELREPPGSVAGIAREYLRGVTPDSLILLDGSVLLKDPRLFIDVDENNGPGPREKP